jgi:predicted amidohydrolase
MREVRVASVQPRDQFHIWSEESPGRARADELKEQNLALAERLLTRAGTLGCDIVCYPECIEGIGCHLVRSDTSLFEEMVEEIPGPISNRMAEIASRYRTHLVYTQYERVGAAIYNAGVLLGREGQILGKYHKVQLPAIESWTVTHGASFPVFRTESGVVGILICYDLAFPEIPRCLALSGAELLFCPTMGIGTRGACEGNGLIQVQARAMDNFLPVTISTCRKDTMIVNSDGGVLAHARPHAEDIITATLDLDARPEDHSQWEMITTVSDVRARLLQERLPEVYQPLVAPHPPVLEQLRDTPIRPAPTERQPFFAARTQWWAEHGPERD